MTDEEVKEVIAVSKEEREEGIHLAFLLVNDEGHTAKCALRQVFKDGECDCMGDGERLRASIDKTLAQGSAGG